MLVDSTVFIDFLRGKEKAKNFLENTGEPLYTSVVVVMEIIAGLESKRKAKDFLACLAELGIAIIHLSLPISQTAFSLFQQFSFQGLGMADSLIAATAIEQKQTIATHNVRHFSLVKALQVAHPY